MTKADCVKCLVADGISVFLNFETRFRNSPAAIFAGA
jgi:hypothetical protein